jgi:hypothetical protein
MKYESFLKLTLGLQKQERVVNELYKKKIDIIDFVDPYHGFITLLLTEIYGEEGYDWFSWFCYENEFGQKGLEAWDENKNRICYSHESLWQYLETNYRQPKGAKTLKL